MIMRNPQEYFTTFACHPKINIKLPWHYYEFKPFEKIKHLLDSQRIKFIIWNVPVRF